MRAKLGAVVAAAALMAAGCTTTVAGQAVPDTLVQKNTEGPAGTQAPTSTSVPEAAPTVGAEPVPAPASLAPGSPIGQKSTDGRRTAHCTAAFVFSKGIDTYLATAGHCLRAEGWDDQVLDLLPRPAVPVGRYVAAESHGTTYRGLQSWPGDIDMGVVQLAPGIRPNPLVAGRYAVADVLTGADLKPGDAVCKYGITTAETCGRITKTGPELVETNLASEEGDSGAPVYVKRPGGTVAAAGVYEGTGRFYLVGPPTAALGLTVVGR